MSRLFGELAYRARLPDPIDGARTLTEFRHCLRNQPDHRVSTVDGVLGDTTGPMWDALADSCDRVNELERTGEIAFVHSLDAVRGYPTMPATPRRSAPRVGPSTGSSRRVRWHPDPLKRIAASTYYEAITGEPVSQGGMALCVFHDDHTPSLRCKGTRWRCFTCDVGGSIIDLGAELWNIEPTGRGYFELRRRLAEALLAGKAAVP